MGTMILRKKFAVREFKLLHSQLNFLIHISVADRIGMYLEFCAGGDLDMIEWVKTKRQFIISEEQL
jgi:hypothetical protein